MVINPDPLSTRAAVGRARRLLFESDINSHLVGVDMPPDIFFDIDNASVAFTGIFRAKGNEAGMVYIINADHCARAFGNLARVRNRLFTAITRSKAWVRVLGVGDRMQVLIEEFEKVKEAAFSLDFVYPTPEIRKAINVINRDMTDAEKRAKKNASEQLTRLVEDVESGRTRIEDLPFDVVDRLKRLL
jgi:superfamily I DNA and RNA helicase